MANTYKTSSGERVTQSQIDALIRVAKQKSLQQQLDDHGYNFCEQCGRNGSGTRLDCSHDYPVGKAKADGKTEKCWDVKNIVIRCRGCHQKRDGLDLKFSTKQ